MKLCVFLMHPLIFSRAIMTYLANQYAPNSSLYPKDAKKRAVIDRVLQFDDGTLNQSFREYIAIPVLRQGKGLKDLDPEKEKKVREALKLLDDSLANQKYVAGNELSLADLSVLAGMTVVDAFNYDISEFKNVTEWNNRLKSELPYYDQVNKEEIEEAIVQAIYCNETRCS